MCNEDRMELHTHLDTSNLRLKDCINKVDELFQCAADLGLKGIAITDHETVASHVKAIRALKKKKSKGEIPQDFKLILGNESYLVDSIEEVRDNYQSGVTKFPHYLMLAKNAKGHEALRILSSHAWDNSFYTGTMERVPTLKSYLEEVVKQFPNSLIVSSACLGSESSIHILEADKAKQEGNQQKMNFHIRKLNDFIEWNIKVHTKDNFFLELQPSAEYEQRTVNEELIRLSKKYNLGLIITNDVHYLRPEDKPIHSAYLRSKEEERETDAFYSHTYLHKNEEIYEKLSYIDKSIIDGAFLNTMKIGQMVEEYELEAPTVIPKTKLPEFEVEHLFKPGYEQYTFIANMANSEDEQDRYLLHLIEEGFKEYLWKSGLSKEKFHEILARIDIELEQLWEISERVNQRMTSYYVTVFHLVNLIWGDDCGENSRYEGSLLGSGRGSAVAFLINYLIGVTQVNPMEYGIEVPYWRHLTKERSIQDLDIDLDVHSAKKPYIFKRMRESFGEKNVLQICTFGTEKSKSAIQTACRGLGIDSDIGQYLASFVPVIRGEMWSLNDCFFGNEELEREPIKEFINEIEKYPMLKETSLKIEGLINKRSIHAGGVLVMDEEYTARNAMMRAPNGTPITQFNLDDTQAMGGIKFDLLTIEAMDKNQTTMELLLENGEIEWQGTLRKTFNKYFHPEVIDKDDPKMFEMVGEANIPDLFQFSTQIAQSAIHKAKPKNLIELLSINSLIRLMTVDSDEQPIDTFIRYKKNLDLWYQDMRNFGLNEDEIKVFEKHLKHLNGVSDTQESIMLMAMDENLSGIDLTLANKLRKAVAKKKRELAEEIKIELYKFAVNLGVNKVAVDYLWVQIERMLLYSFSIPHVLAYTLIAMIQIYMNYKYDPLYWQTACLTVNSGSQEVEVDEKKKSTNYGKVAEAIGKMKSFGVNVSLPSINKAAFSFIPDIENDKIIFSLKGIVGIGDDVVNTIINNRPYNSFDDFYERMYVGKLVQTKHMVQLIKAGAFDEFDQRVNIMKQFIFREVNVKDKLTMSNLPAAINYGLLSDGQFKLNIELFNFKNYLKSLPSIEVSKPKDSLITLDKSAKEFFEQHFTDKCVVDNVKGNYIISEKQFSKQYDNYMLTIKEYFADKNTVRLYNEAQFMELWNKHADGSISKWEMESVSYYNAEHELSNVDREKYGITNFFELDTEPTIESYSNYKGKKNPRYKISTIVGTVLDRNKDKHTISLLTPEGVVICKTYAGNFSFYDRTISEAVKGTKGKITKKTIEKSWFTRGNLLVLRGFRREDQFFLRTYSRNGHKEHTINLIHEVGEDGSLILQAERTRV